MELTRIADDVYACLQEDRGLGFSNSGLINRGGGLVVDTFWDLPHTRRMMELYGTVWPEPARRVLNTHHNGDHCWGNQLFAGSEIIGHRLCAEALGKESPAAIAGLREAARAAGPAAESLLRALEEWDFDGIEITPPTTLFEDRLELDLDGVPVHLIYVGPSHTQGDVIAHLPRQKVVFTGDVLFRLCTPIGWEGTFDNWCDALDRIVALDPETVVPGHGPLCGVEGPEEMKAYLRYVQGEAKRFFESGTDPVEACKRIDLGPYADWTEPERIIFNVDRAYRELRGEPWDAPADVAGIFRGMLALRSHWGRG